MEEGEPPRPLFKRDYFGLELAVLILILVVVLLFVLLMLSVFGELSP